jgi:hypothetical protein
MLLDVYAKFGFSGNPPIKSYTNIAESMNFSLKSLLDQLLPMNKFIDYKKKLDKQLYMNFEKTCVEIRDLEFKKEYKQIFLKD